MDGRPAGTPGWRLSVDLAIRQRLLQPLYALVCDLRVAEAQRIKLRQSDQSLQTAIRDLRVVELQRLELRRPLQMLKALTGDLRFREVQLMELPKTPRQNNLDNFW